MLKKLVTIVISLVLLIVAVVGVFVIAGGGFGDKPPLPMQLQTANRPVLIAHRGATDGQDDARAYPMAPENTLQAFKNAKARNYRWIELDIQYSADGQFIVFHDKYGGSELPYTGTIAESTVGELQAQKLVANGVTTEYTIPTLDGVTAHFDTTLFYYFDMKKYGHNSNIKLADDVAEYIVQRGLQNNVFVASHRVTFIAYLEFAHPEIITTLEGFNRQMAELLGYMPQNFKPDMIAGYQSTLDDAQVSFLRESGWMQRYVTFHVDSLNLKQTLDWGIQYIMLDDGEYVDSLLKLQGFN